MMIPHTWVQLALFDTDADDDVRVPLALVGDACPKTLENLAKCYLSIKACGIQKVAGVSIGLTIVDVENPQFTPSLN